MEHRRRSPRAALLLLLALSFCATLAFGRRDPLPTPTPKPNPSGGAGQGNTDGNGNGPDTNRFTIDTSCWVVDRCAPASFEAASERVEGRSKLVLQASVDTASTCPSGAFYLTQGRKRVLDLPVAQGSSVTYTGSLWIDSTYADNETHPFRSDIWTATSNAGSITAYGIIGFTNQGELGPHFRVWDTNTWVDLDTPVDFGSWSPDLTVSMTRTADGELVLSYLIDGEEVYTSASAPGMDSVREVFVQVFNFEQDKTASWSNLSLLVDGRASQNLLTTCPEVEAAMEPLE